MAGVMLIHPSKKVFGRDDPFHSREYLTPSIGLAMLGGALKKEGFKPSIVDLRLNHQNLAQIFEMIENDPPLLVGIIAFTNEITSAGKIAEEIKKRYKNSFIVIGGPHVTSLPELTLKDYSEFDAAVVGEGEETIVELAKQLEAKSFKPSSVKGIVYRNGNKIKINSNRDQISDLNTLEFPAWELFEMEHYTGPFMVSSSRGCPYPCYFCTPDYLGKVRVRDPLKVVDEIERNVEQFGAKRFQFADATLSLLEKKTFTLCDEIIKRGLHRKIRWDCETRADKIDSVMLQKMKDAGCACIALGVETGSERILAEVIKKGETKEDIRRAVKLIKQAGIKVRCFFILGHYTETKETIKETIDFAIELNPDGLSFGLIVPNPGSAIRGLAEEGRGGLRILHNRWDDYNQLNFSCLESDTLPLTQLKKWQSKAYFKFYSHQPLKALALFLDPSGYNYNIKSSLGIIRKLIGNLLGH